MYGMLVGNVSALTGEYVKPAYGGEKEAFLKKVVTPIYLTIAKVYLVLSYHSIIQYMFYTTLLKLVFCYHSSGSWKEQKRKRKSFWVEKLRWSKWIFLVLVYLTPLYPCCLYFTFFKLQVCWVLSVRLAYACGCWFLLSTFKFTWSKKWSEPTLVITSVSCLLFSGVWNNSSVIAFLQTTRTEKQKGKVNFVELRSFWHIFRSFDRMWSFFILALQVWTSISTLFSSENTSSLQWLQISESYLPLQ